MSFFVRVNVMPKAGISDPQGATIERALPALGYEGVAGVRVGKTIELVVDASDMDDARARVVHMCEHLLANTVIETFQVTME